MQLLETIKLYPTKYQFKQINQAMNEYIHTVNSLVSDAVNGVSILKYTTANLNCNLPSAVANQCIRDAKSIVRKYNKIEFKNTKLAEQGKVVKKTTVPILKKLCCYINNQNYRVKNNNIELPVMINGKSKRISVYTKMTDKQKTILTTSRLGTMRVVKKNNNIVVQIVYDVNEPTHLNDGNIMGVDLGIKCPAVSHISNGNIKFYGNGRQNKYMRRHYNYLRKKLQKSKKIKNVKRINDKEQRIMRDIDHKLSHDIVKNAITHNVKVIKLEQLQNIRSTTRTSRKNNHSLHSWSFYRLAQFIEYKAKRVGITVEYVNPAYTSQKCPVCGEIHHAQDRAYKCTCGYHTHRDIIGAINICNSTEFVGNRQTA